MIIDDKAFKKHTNNKFLIIDALIDIIVKKDVLINNTAYYYHNDDYLHKKTKGQDEYGNN